MMNHKLSLYPPILVLVAGCLVGACTGGAPYVHDETKYDRESAQYREGIKDRTEVVVCYSKSGGTPDQVRELARRECARFGKRAVFREQSY